MTNLLRLVLLVLSICNIIAIVSCTAPSGTSVFNRGNIQAANQLSNKKVHSLNCDMLTRNVAEQLFKGSDARESIEQGIDSCLESAQKGDPNSQYDLSILYITKNGGKENQESFNWIFKAAKKGHPEAQYHLGTMYESGALVNRDTVSAIFWFLKAAQNGITAAQLKLGHYYMNGVAGESDYSKGFFWYEKAASQGSREAMNFLIQIYSKGAAQLPPDKPKEMYWRKIYME